MAEESNNRFENEYWQNRLGNEFEEHKLRMKAIKSAEILTCRQAYVMAAMQGALSRGFGMKEDSITEGRVSWDLSQVANVAVKCADAALAEEARTRK